MVFLGVGKAPLQLLGVVALILFGGVGTALNCLLGTGPFGLNFLLAFICMIFGTRYGAKAFARVIPNVETYSVPTAALGAKQGRVIFTVTETSGMVRVYDQYRNMRDLSARTEPGAPSIEAGAEVFLMHFDDEKQVWHVQPCQEVLQQFSNS